MMQQPDWKELRTRAPNGKEHSFPFTLERSEPGGVWIFRIWRSRDSWRREDFYLAKLRELDEEKIQTEFLDNHCQKWAMRKGISEAVLKEAARRSGRTVVSSRRYVEGKAERRSDLAERMWQRFQREGLAEFVAEQDRWVLTP